MVFCDKKTQRVIARELGISDRAVRYHLEAIEKKFEKFRKTAS
jgi:DNA-binding CsgD family transcriptional regulator